jgi:hypothetical protein
MLPWRAPNCGSGRARHRFHDRTTVRTLAMTIVWSLRDSYRRGDLRTATHRHRTTSLLSGCMMARISASTTGALPILMDLAARISFRYEILVDKLKGFGVSLICLRRSSLSRHLKVSSRKDESMNCDTMSRSESSESTLSLTGGGDCEVSTMNRSPPC